MAPLLLVLLALTFSSSASAFTSHHYSDALTKSIIFFDGQRSGNLPSNQRLKWRADSAVNDGSSTNVDLVGGYYDAGDNVKFGLPMAFTTTMLAWSIIEFGDSMESELGNAKTALREPHSDHSCWERPEDMDTPRNVYKVSPQNPGSDVAAETAAALAAASIVFQDSDPSYSQARTATLSDLLSVRFTARIPDTMMSCCGEPHGSIELLRMLLICLTFNQMGFLEKQLDQFQLYKQHSDNYICSIIPGSPNSQARYTPGGLLYKQGESNLQYVTTSSFLLLTYAKYLNSYGGHASCGGVTFTAETLIVQAKKQIDYILGDNPMKMSYMVGFGDKYPTQIHHRGSSVPSVRVHPDHISCDAGHQYFNAKSPNPNILIGAIVGGPDSNDNYADDRSNYSQSEPATYINAPFVGAAAFFSGR
ncbi:Glycoside hydrolase, family 9 [Cynara cardunculus var. scolymus]|uniref:Endoglucanase n=1 Tax=Cynara cardunculus var. scolymus TaxID=59895 RepID=A0A103XQV0_CYNCS|nr:Glycoside hydrolase, family 9 [Cynara cardunculus var. scolymus]